MEVLVYKHVPFRRHLTISYSEWYSKEFITNTINKKEVHEKWLQFGVFVDQIEYKRLKVIFAHVTRDS